MIVTSPGVNTMLKENDYRIADIKLADYGVQHMALGKKVADEIEINVNIVGSNGM